MVDVEDGGYSKDSIARAGGRSGGGATAEGVVRKNYAGAAGKGTRTWQRW